MSWKKVKLKEVLKQYRVQHIVQNDFEYKQVTISKYDGVTYRGTKIGKEIGRKRQFIVDLKNYPNTLMLVRQGVQDGSIGIAPMEVDGCIATENMPMFSIEGIDLEYLRFLLKSPYFYDELNKIETTGSAQKSIHERQILEIEIPLPNIEEQKQFVKELTILKNGGLEISSELIYQLDLIKQLRQAFLREAMQGKLVRSWELGVGSETGHDLLAKIKAEKAKLIADKKLKKEKELPPITEEEIPYEIPEHWAWCRLGEICSKIGSGSTPKGSNYAELGKPFFRSQNIYDNGLVFDDIKYISEEVQQQMNGTVVLANDILLNITGGSMGRCALVPNDFEEGNVSQHVCIIRPLLLNNVFLHKLVLSPYLQKLIFSSTSGAGREGLPKYNLEQFIIPLPPLYEQEQIVAKLEELMAFCDGLEESIKESQGYNKMLLQEVLREALKARKN
jgi:type I restriction enzyme S subunit